MKTYYRWRMWFDNPQPILVDPERLDESRRTGKSKIQVIEPGARKGFEELDNIYETKTEAWKARVAAREASVDRARESVTYAERKLELARKALAAAEAEEGLASS